MPDAESVFVFGWCGGFVGLTSGDATSRDGGACRPPAAMHRGISGGGGIDWRLWQRLREKSLGVYDILNIFRFFDCCGLFFGCFELFWLSFVLFGGSQDTSFLGVFLRPAEGKS